MLCFLVFCTDNCKLCPLCTFTRYVTISAFNKPSSDGCSTVDHGPWDWMGLKCPGEVSFRERCWRPIFNSQVSFGNEFILRGWGTWPDGIGILDYFLALFEIICFGWTPECVGHEKILLWCKHTFEHKEFILWVSPALSVLHMPESYSQNWKKL